MLSEHVGITHITLKITGNNDSIFRPHRDSLDGTGGVDKFQELQSIEIPATDGGTAAIGWILHHAYKGAVPNTNLQALRLRSGNIQVCGNGLFEHPFAEIRVNSSSVGENH